MAALFRTVIAETARFPELGRSQFNLGKGPFLNGLRK
jgi:TetR/AcrR family transcriptional regulator of autoinduction and epiphytic fitness